MPKRSLLAKDRRLDSRRDHRGRKLKRGDKIRIVGLPKSLRNEGDMQTKTIFKLCHGRVFRIVGFFGDGIHEDWIELHVGRVVGEPGYKHSIFIEPALVEVVDTTN